MKKILIAIFALGTLTATAQGKKKARKAKVEQAAPVDATFILDSLRGDGYVIARLEEPIVHVIDTTYKIETKRIFYEADGYVKIADAKLTYEVITADTRRLIMILIDDKRLPIQKLINVIE